MGLLSSSERFLKWQERVQDRPVPAPSEARGRGLVKSVFNDGGTQLTVVDVTFDGTYTTVELFGDELSQDRSFRGNLSVKELRRQLSSIFK